MSKNKEIFFINRYHAHSRYTKMLIILNLSYNNIIQILFIENLLVKTLLFLLFPPEKGELNKIVKSRLMKSCVDLG